MRPLYRGGVLGLLLFVTGIGLSDDRQSSGRTRVWEDELESITRQVSASDCSFERDPDHFTEGVRRTIETLSVRTARVVPGDITDSDAAAKGSIKVSIKGVPYRNYIDELVFGKMQQDGIPYAGLSSDAQFLRRVTLDLTGRIPSSSEVRAFLTSDDSKKRSNLIKALLASPEFVDKWTMYYGDLLKNTSTDGNITRYVEGRNAFHKFIRDAVESGMPYDVFVKRIITGSGNTWVNGEANWVLGATTPMGPIQDTYDTMAVRSATQFLGLSNLDCILCHNGEGHLDKLNLWATALKRTEAWELASFFSRYRSTRSANQSTTGGTLYYWTISDAASGDYALNTTAGNRTPRQPSGQGNTVRPRYIFAATQEGGSTYREMFANNLIRDRQFARATVNYLWKEMMGLGIVEPADQFDLSRLDPSKPLPSGWTVQPSHPQLLEALTDDFIRSGFNVRYLLGTIADSSAYQMSSRFPAEWRVEYTAYFARKFVRRLMAEEVHDAISKATGVLGSYNIAGFDQPVQWAMKFPEVQTLNGVGDPRGEVGTFINFFLRGNRDTADRSDEATIFQALGMMNHNFVVTRVRNSNATSLVRKLLSTPGISDAEIVEELYLATLSRFPTAQEAALGKVALQGNRTQGTENLHWALLNKIDFLYNY